MLQVPFINHERDGAELISDLCNVPDEAALVTARFFEHSAKKLRERHQLWQVQLERKKRTKNSLASITRLPGRLLDQMLAGNSYEDAVAILCENENINPSHVHHHWLRFIKEIEKQAKRDRETKILKLYYAGMSDRQIANAVNLSERSVRYVLQKNLKKSP